MGSPSSGYGVPSAAPLGNAPSSGYGVPSGNPLSNAPGGAQNSPLPPPPPYQGPIMKAPRGPMPNSDSNNAIQENSYGSPVNGNSIINGK